SKFRIAQVGQSSAGFLRAIRRHSFFQTSNCISELWRSSVAPVRSFKASAVWTAATTFMIGIITPAVSQVGALAAAGASGKMQRRHGVWPGRIAILTPYDPTAAP